MFCAARVIIESKRTHRPLAYKIIKLNGRRAAAGGQRQAQSGPLAARPSNQMIITLLSLAS